MSTRRSILIIYTGGTIGMQTGASNEGLVPVHFSDLIRNLPELRFETPLCGEILVK